MKTSTKLFGMFSAFCAFILLGMTANAQSISVTPNLTATQMAQMLVGSNVTVTNATYTGAATASGSFNQSSSTFPLTDGIILTSGSAVNALGPNNSTGSSTSNNTPGDADLGALVPGIQTFDAAVLEFDITSNCNTVTFDYIFASEEYPEYGCSNFNDAFGFLISGPGFAPNTNIALVPGTTIPVSINNVINSPATNCVSNPSYYVDNAAGVSVQYDGYTVVMTATATIQPCQTYHVKIVVGDAGDSALDSAIFLKGGGINCTSPSLATTANITAVECGALGAIDLSVNSGTGPFTYAWTGPNGFTATTEDLTGLAVGDYTVDIVGSDCLSSGQATFTVTETVDATAPVFASCPSDMVIEAANNGCAFTVIPPIPPSVNDNCGVTSLTTSVNGGTIDLNTYQFGVGTTTVTYTATDDAGNTSTCNFNVTVNAQPLEVTLVPHQFNGNVNIKCYGESSGFIDSAYATGGCCPYTYEWVHPQFGLQTVTECNTPLIGAGFGATPGLGLVPVGPYPWGGATPPFGFPAGPFEMTVTDANGTSVTETITLIENPPVTATATWAPIDCYGGSTTVNLTVQAGTMPYNGVTQYDNVSTGTYDYAVSDANGCRAFDTIFIDQPDLLDATATPDPILCFGDTTTVLVDATGGTMPYTGVGPFPAVAGTYSYDIVDANGCTENVQLTINQPAQLMASISATPILCHGGTGIVSVSVMSGTEPYTGDGDFVEEAGWHTYTVYDYNLCSDTIGIFLDQPDPMVSSISATPILCNGGTSTITVTGTGGTGAWTGTGTFIEPAGTYGYSFTDANGCTDTNSIVVTEPTALLASISATSIDCNGGTADVTVTATGGTAPLTGTGTFTVTSGTHNFTVTDANGCTTTVSITVTEPTALVASASATTIDCFGGTADVTVAATGGTAPLTGTGSFTVGGGTSDYTVTDANGCTSTVSVTVVEPSALSATATVGAFDCATLTADVTIVATGGTAPYTGDGVVTQSEGTTTYTIIDANGCSVTVDATVQTQSFVNLNCPGDQTYACDNTQTCGGQNTGSIVSWDEPTATSFGTCNTGCGPVTCISGFVYMGEYNGSRYYCSTSSNYTWQQANAAAIQNGGHLATIGSAGENQFLANQIPVRAWIGYNDFNQEGTFEWENGESVAYTNWASGQPDNTGYSQYGGCCANADGAVIRGNGYGTWYDWCNSNTEEFVMEIPCGNPITITQTSGPSNGSFVQGGTTQVVTYVATDDVTGATATCSFTIVVEECVPVYCESSGSCTAYEWIDQVSLGSINNLSGNDGGYGDYTSMVAVASPGNMVNLQLTPGFSGSAYTEAWRVWVDWNYDGDFNDQGEMVYQGASTSTLNGSFTVPSFATLNKNLRVRVSMRWNCYAGPCSYFQYGEVEDYTIYIQSGIDGMATVIGEGGNDLKQGNTALNNVKSYEDVVEDGSIEGGVGLEVNEIYPNPVLATNGTFNLDIRTGSKAEVTVRIIDLSGKVMMTDFMLLEIGANKRTMDVTGYARGSYLVEVISGDLKETTQLIVQ